MNEDGELIHTVEPDPYKKDRIEFWHEVGKDLIRESHAAIDESSRQILQINGMLISLYAAIFAFSDILKLELTDSQKGIFLAPLALFLFSLVFALMVFFLDRNTIQMYSASSIKQFYQSKLKSKMACMKTSAIFLTLGVAAILLALGLYLFSV